MSISRRNFLFSGAAVAVLPALAGCATTGSGTWGLDPRIIDLIQKGVAFAAQYIPTVESIAATAASLFGPAYVAVVQAGSAALNQIIQVLTAAVSNLTPAARRSMRKRLRASSPSSPVFIGTTITGVNVTGYRI
jgi:hypothetical protein